MAQSAQKVSVLSRHPGVRLPKYLGTMQPLPAASAKAREIKMTPKTRCGLRSPQAEGNWDWTGLDWTEKEKRAQFQFDVPKGVRHPSFSPLFY